MQGIYQIRNNVTGKIYIGSSIDIEHRWYRHKLQLEKNKHGNMHLQRAWNKYGIESFSFSVLEEVYEESEILNREQYWLDTFESYKNKNGYNICSKAGSSLGTVHKEHTKALIGKRSKERNAVQNILGMSVKGENHHKAKLTDEQVKIIKLLIRDDRLNIREIGDIFDVSRGYVSKIKCNRFWKHVTITDKDNLPEKYETLIFKIIQNQGRKKRSI